MNFKSVDSLNLWFIEKFGGFASSGQAGARRSQASLKLWFHQDNASHDENGS